MLSSVGVVKVRGGAANQGAAADPAGRNVYLSRLLFSLSFVQGIAQAIERS